MSPSTSPMSSHGLWQRPVRICLSAASSSDKSPDPSEHGKYGQLS